MVVGGVNNKRVTLDEPDVFPYTGACYQAIPNMFRERYDIDLIEDIYVCHTLCDHIVLGEAVAFSVQ